MCSPSPEQTSARSARARRSNGSASPSASGSRFRGLPDEGFGALRGVADLRCRRVRLQLLAPSHRLDDPAEQPGVGAREQLGKPHVRGDQAVRPAQGHE
ncbi:hypothetical protein [[Kitasatospora] papulosa]|uniref:hypothetical protein n=1 Tax=[Kitasatospora] papulosa TaxID=1464011 RepID=UPI0037134D9D